MYGSRGNIPPPPSVPYQVLREPGPSRGTPTLGVYHDTEGPGGPRGNPGVTRRSEGNGREGGVWLLTIGYRGYSTSILPYTRITPIYPLLSPLLP